MLHPGNSTHVVVETNVNLFRGQTQEFSTSRQLDIQFVETPEGIQTSLDLATLGFQIIDVGVVLIDLTRTVQSRDALFTQRGVEVENDGVETERRSRFVFRSLHLLRRIANVRVTHLGLRHTRAFPIQEEGFLGFAQDDLIQSIRVLEVRFLVIQFDCSVGNHWNNFFLHHDGFTVFQNRLAIDHFWSLFQLQTSVFIIDRIELTSAVESVSSASEHTILHHG